MENRFGLKDLVVVILLVVLILSVWLAMKQWDRQGEQLQTISNRLDDQGRSIIDIQKTLASGVALNAPADRTQTPATTPAADPFARMRAARAMAGFATGGLLLDAFGNSVGKLTPLVSTDAYADAVQQHVLESLAFRDRQSLAWVPLLAESWRVVDQVAQQDAAIASLKAQGKTPEQIAADPSVPPAILIIFKMRPGICFSDGQPLTADDVLFTYQWTMNPKVNAPRDRAYLARITKLEKTAPDEVTFTFREPYYGAFELAASIAILPQHFYSAYTPEQFNDSVGLLLGSGPYRLEDPTSWKPGTLIKLVSNERYWGVGGAYATMAWREISNDAAHLAAFRNGDVDVYPATPEQYTQMLKDPAVLKRTYHFEFDNPRGGYNFIAWNELKDNKPTIFADPRVRRAMTMLLDRERIRQQVLLGYATQATGPFSPQSKQCNPVLKPLPYDVEGAIKLLKDAGFADRDGDGIIESPTGEKFSFKLTYGTGSANAEKMVLMMKDAYMKAGIILVPDPLDWAVMVERLNKKNFQAIMLGWTADLENDIFQIFHSSQVIAEGDNFISYKSPALDTVIDQARRTIDENKRMQLWQEAHRILYEDQPYTFLFFPKALVFVDQRIKNVQRTTMGLNLREEWFSPKQMQRMAN